MGQLATPSLEDVAVCLMYFLSGWPVSPDLGYPGVVSRWTPSGLKLLGSDGGLGAVPMRLGSCGLEPNGGGLV